MYMYLVVDVQMGDIHVMLTGLFIFLPKAFGGKRLCLFLYSQASANHEATVLTLLPYSDTLTLYHTSPKI